ncbi:MAG: serine/threonine-protein phosphatase [Phycisphaerales bacterium]|nr:serine/threonine-protein phosphatase [Phycisphaerales bacterium]
MPAARDQSALSSAALEQERLVVLRDRITVFTLVLGILVILIALATTGLALLLGTETFTRPRIVRLASQVVFGVLIIVIPRLRRRSYGTMGMSTLVRRVGMIIMAALLAQTAGADALTTVLNDLAARLGSPAVIGPAFALALFFLLMHTAASFVVPWTPAEAVRPALVLLVIANLLALADGGSWSLFLVVNGLAVVVSAPGLLVAWLRTAGFREYLALRLISGRYDDMRRELAAARRVHERVFPIPVAGPVGLAYRYEPMNEIGGDYLDAVERPDGSLLAVVVDVTGHGIAAALAVNRLHGEAKRVLAQEPELPPGRLLAALNDYIVLTLAEEQMFATAVAILVDPVRKQLVYSSAGHPPLLLIRRGGSVEALDSTTFVLGAVRGDAFDETDVTIGLQRGERVMAYTDGAFERRDAEGNQLGMEAFESVVEDVARSNDGIALDDLLDQVTQTIDRSRVGEPEDDTLIVVLDLAAGNAVQPQSASVD